MDLEKFWNHSIVFVKECLRKLIKSRHVEKIRDYFELPENAKIILFRNPNEFNHFQVEKINPTHKMILYGQLKKKYRHCRKAYYIMCGKIRIPFIMFVDMAFLFKFMNLNIPLTIGYSILSTILTYYMFFYPMLKSDTYVNRNTRRVRNWKNFTPNSIPT